MRNLFINAGRDSTQIFKEILDEITYTSELFSVELEDKRIIVHIYDEKNEQIYIDYISSKVANFILNFIEPKMIRDEVELECLDLLDDEIETAIAEKVEWELLHKNKQLRQNYFKKIKDEIFNGFVNHNMFNLFGFLNFRLQMRKIEIRDYINIALEDYFEDENEEKFIALIKRVVSIQRPHMKLLHLILLGYDEYEIFTGNNERVDIKDAEKILEDYSYNQPVEQLHLILSIFMTLIPEKIIIHNSKEHNPYIVQTLKKIYSEKVIICEYCDFCEKVRILKEEENNWT